MDRDEIKEDILRVVKENIESITERDVKKEDINLEDEFGRGYLVLSSLDYVMLVVGLERDLNLVFPDEQIDFHGIRKVNDLVDLLYNVNAEKKNVFE